MIQYKYKSLALKLILFLSGSCSLILLAIFAVNYRFSRRMILKNVEENARNLTLRTVSKIDSVALSVQKVPDNLAHFIEHGTLDQQRMLAMLRTVAMENKEVTGVTVIFDPYAYKKNLRCYTPYFFKINGKLGYSDNSDYFLWDIYRIPRELGAPAWSEPYFDPDAKVPEVTYSVPFYENVGGKRKIKGIVTADISLAWLPDIISSVKVLKTGNALLLSQNGTIISHPVKDLIMNESIFSVAEAHGDANLRETGRKMIRGESGFGRFRSLAGNQESWLYFAPVPSTGWSLGVRFPDNELMEDITRLNGIMAAIGVIGIALLVFVIFVIARSITGPLHGMAKAAEAIGAGDLDAELPPVTSEDEVGKLAAAFRYMKTSLKQYVQDLKETTAAKERIESELNIAREIQASMLPHIFPPFPHRKEFELFAMMEPAKEIGGDFYDFFPTSGSKLFFLIGDVSGKGVPAALFMMITKAFMKNEALQQLAPQEVLRKVNNIVALDNDSSMFATIFCGVLDTETGEVEFANAGHNPPVLCRKDRPNEFLKMDHGCVLGPMPDTKFTLQKIRLDPGDTLFLYTDGVTEAMNPQKQLFSDKRLQQALMELRDRDVSALIRALRDEIRRYAGDEPQSDDITMLALKFKGRISS